MHIRPTRRQLLTNATVGTTAALAAISIPEVATTQQRVVTGATYNVKDYGRECSSNGVRHRSTLEGKSTD